MPRKPPLPLFARRLTALREAAGLTIATLADAAGIDRAFVYCLEKGTKAPSWETVQKLADALNVATDAFRKEE